MGKKEDDKRYYEKNKEKIAKYKKEWGKNVSKDKKRESKLKSRYGITLNCYNDLLKSQNNSCKICNSTDVGRKGLKNLLVDHCHKENKVRGLLCDGCNKLLGHAKDDISILQKAIEYLKEN